MNKYTEVNGVNLLQPHILYFSNHLRGPKGSAGARSWHQAKAISENNQITIIIPSIDPVSSQPVTDKSFEGLNKNANVIRIKTTKNNRHSKMSRSLFYLSAMWSQLLEGFRTKNVDLILSMSLPVTLLASATFVAKARRIPLIVDVRDLPFETASELGYIKSKFFINMLKKLENFCLKQADTVFTNSPRYIPYLVKYGVKEDKIILAPIGYDDFPPPSLDFVNEWKNKIISLFDTKPKHIAVYAGTIGYAFPVEEILDGAKLLNGNKDIGFVFVGDGQRIEEFKEYAQQHKINAVFLGRVTKMDTHAICNACDVCLYPAKQGEFSASILGNKVFDYLGAGKPIVYIGPDSAVADVIIELNAGVICRNGNATYFADALSKLLKTPSQYQLLAEGALKFRDAGYTAQHSAQKLLNCIASKTG